MSEIHPQVSKMLSVLGEALHQAGVAPVRTGGNERKIIKPNRGTNGLIVQPKATGPDRELIENHHRDAFAAHFDFADTTIGRQRTFDPKGDYNCGRCNMSDGDMCLLLKIDRIDRNAGSCEDWENICAGDPEQVLHAKTPEEAAYGAAANGHGFGCHRCPYASLAHEPDSQGRTLYCGKGDFRTFWNACCAINGAPLKKVTSKEYK